MTVNTQEIREAAEAFKQACDDGLFDSEFGTWQALSHEFDQQVSHTVVIALLDEIDALRAELQARQWISVDDDWPREGALVLALDKQGDVEIVFGSLIHETFHEGTYSHWQTLPPAPPQGETA